MTQKTRQIKKKKGNSCIRFFFLSLRGAVEINTKLHLPQSASEAEDTSYERDAHAISPITWSDGSGSLSALRNAISLVAGRKARQDPPQASDWFEYLLQITFPFLFPPPAKLRGLNMGLSLVHTVAQHIGTAMCANNSSAILHAGIKLRGGGRAGGGGIIISPMLRRI